MAVQLWPGNLTQLVVGYNFTMGEVKLIYSFYADDNLSLWEIKETKFNKAQIKDIAVVITHAQMDI